MADLKQEAEAFLDSWQKEEQKRISIALFGQPGSGKSSLINELVGMRAAEVSNVTDTTKAAQVIEHKDVLFVDLPGYDTSTFPQNEYFSRFDPLQYDLFLCVFSGKLHEADTRFFRELTEKGRCCLFVRNKADGIYDEGKTQEESRTDICRDVAEQTEREVQVYFTSCRHGKSAQSRGIVALQTAILANLGGAKADKFVRCANAYTEELLQKKRAASQRYVNDAMLRGAINGINPIFGVDMGIDIEIMRRMYKHIRESFAISDEDVSASKAQGMMVDLIKKGLSKESITAGLKKAMTEKMEKKMTKYIPYIGQVAAMGVGAGSMYYLGYEYIDACYDFALKRLQEEIGHV